MIVKWGSDPVDLPTPGTNGEPPPIPRPRPAGGASMITSATVKKIPSQQPAQSWPHQRGYASRHLDSDHREITRRQQREARIYDTHGRRKPGTVQP